MGYSLEEIAEGSTGRLWFQLYLWKSEEVVNSVISPAYAAGCEALVATVDVPVVGKRERRASSAVAVAHAQWTRDHVRQPCRRRPGDEASSIGEYANRELTDPALTWDDLSLIRHRWVARCWSRG